MLTAGFNPCFTGLPSRTIAGTLPRRKNSSKFQSLFYWITFSDIKHRWKRTFCLPVSILVLLDFLFGLGIGGLVPFFILFQSLFYWITLSDNPFPIIETVFQSFNPCFAGFPFRTYTRATNRALLTCFNPCFAGFPFRTRKRLSNHSVFFLVSILVLLDFLFGHMLLLFQGSECMFQSLFCWISFSDIKWQLSEVCVKRFQSLFCWISFSDTTCR